MPLHVTAANLKLPAPSTGRTPPPQRLFSSSVRCEVSTSAMANRVTTVKNGNDALEICRVVNGTWQTSGGWGRIDREDAVDSMLRYADAGLSTFDMADHLNKFGFSSSQVGVFERRSEWRRVKRGSGVVKCGVVNDEKMRVVVKNGKDSLDICRVVNGMWQTSGGWGKIERDSAVDSMLKYADAGLNTFDMADICKTDSEILFHCYLHTQTSMNY